MNQWKYKEDIIFSHDLYPREWVESEIMEIKILEDSDAFCQSMRWFPVSYSWETHCVTPKTLNQVYTEFISRNKEVNFLKHITPNVNYQYNCTEKAGCISIDYLWKNKDELALRVLWGGGEDNYFFKAVNGHTYAIEGHSAD